MQALTVTSENHHFFFSIRDTEYIIWTNVVVFWHAVSRMELKSQRHLKRTAIIIKETWGIYLLAEAIRITEKTQRTKINMEWITTAKQKNPVWQNLPPQVCVNEGFSRKSCIVYDHTNVLLPYFVCPIFYWMYLLLNRRIKKWPWDPERL